MNPYTGHLITQEMYDAMNEIEKMDYVDVPAYLEHSATKKLQGGKEAWVSLKSGGKLSSFAAANRKQRRKMLAESRKANRGK